MFEENVLPMTGGVLDFDLKIVSCKEKQETVGAYAPNEEVFNGNQNVITVTKFRGSIKCLLLARLPRNAIELTAVPCAILLRIAKGYDRINDRSCCNTFLR